MRIQPADEAPVDEGLNSIEADFFTEQFVVRGAVISPEMRLSDHLNSSTTTLELKPSQVQRSLSDLHINVAGNNAYLSKAHLLFVLPIRESVGAKPDDSSVWTPTITQTCWAGLGRYNLLGKIHMEAGRNPRLFLRSLEQRQFLPFTDARITYPDGSNHDYPVVVVNRFHMELLVLEGAREEAR